MKKLFILGLVILFMGIISATDVAQNLKSDKVYTTTLGDDDSVHIVYKLYTRDLKGEYSIQWLVTNIAGVTKVKLHEEFSNDSVSWYERTLIDSCVAADSGYVSKKFKVAQFVRYTWKAWGTAGVDTNEVKYWIKVIMKD